MNEELSEKIDAMLERQEALLCYIECISKDLAELRRELNSDKRGGEDGLRQEHD